MTLEEKVGQMFHPPFILKPDLLMLLYEIATRGNSSTESQIIFDHISHFNLYGNPSPAKLAKKINSLQKTAVFWREFIFFANLAGLGFP